MDTDIVDLDEWMMQELLDMSNNRKNAQIEDRYSINFYDLIQSIWETENYLTGNGEKELSDRLFPTLKGIKTADCSIEEISKFQLGMLGLLSSYDYSIWDTGQMFRNPEAFKDTLHEYKIDVGKLFSNLKTSMFAFFETFFDILLECVTYDETIGTLSIKNLLKKLEQGKNNIIHMFCCFSLINDFCSLKDFVIMMKLFFIVRMFNVGVKVDGNKITNY